MSSPFIGFHHIALIVSNYEVSKHFYVNILGAEIIAETYREARDSYKLDLRFADNSQIELFSFPTPPARLTNPEACGLRHLAFKVEDIEATINYLKQHQVECEPVRIDELTGKQFTFFKDPDGLPLELYQWSTE
ncbi:VOC family protein [Gallibacterium melopsittaci]|uniref:VOC family protein n=1 Tax=Gallibacterium melopsittaci TaxID=516063 RepID=A0ABV6HVQ6_9PAST